MLALHVVLMLALVPVLIAGADIVGLCGRDGTQRHKWKARGLCGMGLCASDPAASSRVGWIAGFQLPVGELLQQLVRRHAAESAAVSSRRTRVASGVGEDSYGIGTGLVDSCIQHIAVFAVCSSRTHHLTTPLSPPSAYSHPPHPTPLTRPLPTPLTRSLPHPTHTFLTPPHSHLPHPTHIFPTPSHSHPSLSQPAHLAAFLRISIAADKSPAFADASAASTMAPKSPEVARREITKGST